MRASGLRSQRARRAERRTFPDIKDLIVVRVDENDPAGRVDALVCAQDTIPLKVVPKDRGVSLTAAKQRRFVRLRPAAMSELATLPPATRP